MVAVKSVTIYSEPRYRAVDFDEIAAYVRDKLPHARIEVRPPLLEQPPIASGNGSEEERLERLAQALARAKVKRMDAPVPPYQAVLPGELDYERRRLANSSSMVYGLLYDAFILSALYRKELGELESRLDTVNVVFTNQLIGTWDDSDLRYHARTIVSGAPSIISLSGIVEAPAKSQGYYLARQGAEVLGLGEEEKMELARSFADDCLEQGDPRMSDVVKGYLMQAVAYRITDEPFCSDPHCRLFNAHWQRELLEAQLGGDYEFCEKHRNALYH